jgi:hypothetical protein
MRTYRQGIAGMVCSLGLAFTGQAETIYIDFGRTGAETTASGWNNVAATVGGTANNTTTINGQGTPGTPSVELIDSTGTATGAAGSGADYAGPYPATVSTWPTTALSDGFFSQINNGGSTMNMSFTGLDNSASYDLMFYGARGGTGTALNQALYTVTGGNGTSNRTSSVLNNSSQTPEFLGVTPNGGTILVSFTRGSAGTGSLNAMSITAVPEPATVGFGLVALGSVFIMLRRRVDR